MSDTDAPPARPGPQFIGRLLTITGVLLGAVLLTLCLWFARDVLLLMFGGLLFAVLLRFFVEPISRHSPLGERWALALVLALLLGLLAAFAALVGPSLGDELRALQSGLAGSLRSLRASLEATALGGWLLEQLPEPSEQQTQALWARLGGLSASAFGALGSLLVVLLVGVFFAFDPRLYVAGLLRLLPPARRPRAVEVIDRLGHTLRWWLLGQLISMLFLWLSTWLMLHLLGVPLAFGLGLLTGLLTFVPYLGPLIALLPIGLLAFSESPSLGLAAVGLYFVIQNIEGNLLMPLVLQRLVHVPPALSIGAQLLMAGVAGLLGVALATPLVAVALVLVQCLYVEDVLGDSLQEPLDPAQLRQDAAG
jgi:predicted PurR-regulated permease PerM